MGCMQLNDSRNMTEKINQARKRFVKDYALLGLSRQPDTKPRDEEERLRMIAYEAKWISRKVDRSRFKPAPQEVVDAYANRPQYDELEKIQQQVK